MTRLLMRSTLLLLILLASITPAAARDGDTLLPIQIDPPQVQTWPEDMLGEEDARVIEARVREARNSGVPLAVRIVDMTLPAEDLPSQVRRFAADGFTTPVDQEQQQRIGDAWVNSEPIETSPGADDGFLLLVLMPEDRTQTQAIWWIGPNALPLNGLTMENTLATYSVMNQQFAEGNVPNGVFLGISEFSYNIQFGEPHRLTRTELQDALHWAMVPIAMVTAAAGLAVPVLAYVLSRRNNNTVVTSQSLSPWEAATLHMGRARSEIPAAMLLDSVHRGEVTPLADGGLRIEPGASGAVIDVLRPFADDDGILDQTAMYEIEAIASPIRDEIEDSLAGIGAMTPRAKTDRTWVLLAMALAGFLMVLSVVPTIVSMSAPGVYGIVLAGIGVAAGWWWIGYRSYTSPAGRRMVGDWLEGATEAERAAFDTAVHQDLLTNPVGGPDVTNQMRLARRLRGLGSA